MINRKHRFHGHNSLTYVYRNGRNVRGPLMAIKYITNSRRTDYRLAVVVSKKVSKSAVTRNRIRRRLYEAVRRHEPQLIQSYDIVVTVFSETLKDLPADQVERMVTAQLKQAGILNFPK
jgi:ribonuclease P protein component